MIREKVLMTARLPLRALAPLALLAALAAAGTARAELYKWVDDDGNVTYSQDPPPDREATTVAPPPPLPDNPTKPLKTDDVGESTEQKAKREANQKADQDAAKADKQNCEAARRNLEIYQNYRRIQNEKGEITVLDDANRAKLLKTAQDQIKQFCR
jgi:hypothetical protein